MRLVLIVEASADGYESKEQELDAIKVMLEDLDSSSFSIKVQSCERIIE